MNFILIQIIGGIGFILLTMSYYKEEKKNILFMQIMAYIMFTIHYYLLSGISGALCNLIGLFALIMIYIFEKYNWRNKHIIVFLFVLLLIVINIITFQNFFSIFPAIASTIVIVSFLMDNEDFIRCIGIVSAICWLIYAVAYHSYVSIIFQIFSLIGVFTASLKSILNKASNKKI